MRYLYVRIVIFERPFFTGVASDVGRCRKNWMTTMAGCANFSSEIALLPIRPKLDDPLAKVQTVSHLSRVVSQQTAAI